MAYTMPPTFVDGNVLSAAQLNILSDDIAFLYGLSSAANIPVASVSISAEQPNPWTWRIRHRSRYLNIYVSYDIQIATTVATLTTTYGGETVSTVDLFAASGVDPDAYWISVDLDAFGPFTVGAWYDITVDPASNGVAGQEGFDYLTVYQIFESDTALA